VPKVVEPDAWQGALGDQPVESLGHRLRVHCPPSGWAKTSPWSV
jgi:hypothetical protein